MQTTLTISLSQAHKAYNALADNTELFSQLKINGADEYLLPEYDEADAEDNQQLKDEIEDQLTLAGVTEFGFQKYKKYVNRDSILS